MWSASLFRNANGLSHVDEAISEHLRAIGRHPRVAIDVCEQRLGFHIFHVAGQDRFALLQVSISRCGVLGGVGFGKSFFQLSAKLIEKIVHFLEIILDVLHQSGVFMLAIGHDSLLEFNTIFAAIGNLAAPGIGRFVERAGAQFRRGHGFGWRRRRPHRSRTGERPGRGSTDFDQAIGLEFAHRLLKGFDCGNRFRTAFAINN